MKKVLTTAICFLLIACMSGCNKSVETSETEKSKSSSKKNIEDGDYDEMEDEETSTDSITELGYKVDLEDCLFSIPSEDNSIKILDDMGFEYIEESQVSYIYSLVTAGSRACCEAYVFKSDVDDDYYIRKESFDFEYNEYYSSNSTLNVVCESGDCYFAYISNDMESVYYYTDGIRSLKFYVYSGYESVADNLAEEFNIPKVSDVTGSDNISTEKNTGSDTISFGVTLEEWVSQYRENYLYYEDLFDIQSKPGDIDSADFLNEIEVGAFVHKPSNVDSTDGLCYVDEISDVCFYAVWQNEDGLITRMALYVDASFAIAANADNDIAKIWTSMQLAMFKIAYPDLDDEEIVSALWDTTEGMYIDAENSVCALITESIDTGCMLYIVRGDTIDVNEFDTNNVPDLEEGLSEEIIDGEYSDYEILQVIDYTPYSFSGSLSQLSTSLSIGEVISLTSYSIDADGIDIKSIGNNQYNVTIQCKQWLSESSDVRDMEIYFDADQLTELGLIYSVSYSIVVDMNDYSCEISSVIGGTMSKSILDTRVVNLGI